MAVTRRTILQAAVAAAFAGAACAATAASAKKSIVIYFSRTGTIEGLAKTVAQLTGSDILKLELVKPYADEYSAMTYIAREERASGARREIATKIPDLSGYDTIYIGTPYWWGGVSIPMRTFLTDHPMAGKTVVPFVVSGSSAPDGAWADIRKCCPKEKILEGFHRTQGEASGCEADLKAWLKSLKLI